MPLIVIEAGDGSGKETQTALLFERLKADGHKVRRISFPDYDSESSALIKMYLRGDFGAKAEAVNPYAAACFYAADRYASFKIKWQGAYEAGEIILADRYVTSNMVHQAVKIAAGAARDEFLTWLADFEYNKLALPKPDKVIFLDMEPEAAEKLMANRALKAGESKDIHEADREYLRRCHSAYQELAARYGWSRILCSQNGEALSPAVIHEAVYKAAQIM